ncbi:MAG: cysteine desulfurase family protein, partial [Sandaracinaceae bacterium]
VGTVHPIEAIGAIAKEHEVLFHCDAVQGLSTKAMDVSAMGVDLVSLSAHKMYGPKGVGALWVRRRGPRVRLLRQMHGGGQEDGQRAGTLNVPGIVGLGRAAELAVELREHDHARIAAMRDRLQTRLEDELGGVLVHGCPDHRHPGNLHVCFEGVDAEALMLALQARVAMSASSACASGAGGASHVLRAMGFDGDARHDSLRMGLGRATQEQDVDQAADDIVAAARRLRATR